MVSPAPSARRRRSRAVIAVAVVGVVAAVASLLVSGHLGRRARAVAAEWRPARPVESVEPAADDPLSVARSVAGAWLTRPLPPPTQARGWEWATWADGVRAAYEASGDPVYLDAIEAWGRRAGWQLDGGSPPPAGGSIRRPPPVPADGVKAGQTYLWATGRVAGSSSADVVARLRADLVRETPSASWWIDSLYMGLPTLAAAGSAPWGGEAYLDRMDAAFAWARDDGRRFPGCRGETGLFDVEQSLWWRDCRFAGVRTANGTPVFWARGNGWVMQACAEILAALPPDSPHRAPYASMLRTMAARMAQLQRDDGLWASSLLDRTDYPDGETSASALIVASIAWGVRSGLLPGDVYRPVLDRAWAGLTARVDGSGGLAGCQPAGDKPALASPEARPFCVGAFLLAASDMARV